MNVSHGFRTQYGIKRLSRTARQPFLEVFMTELEGYRKEIDWIDMELAALFSRRMEVVKMIAACKKNAGAPILDAAREEAMRARMFSYFEGKELLPYYKAFFEATLAISKDYQKKLGGDKT